MVPPQNRCTLIGSAVAVAARQATNKAVIDAAVNTVRARRYGMLGFLRTASDG